MSQCIEFLCFCAARPGTKVTFNPLQQARLDKDRRFEVVSETGSASSSDDPSDGSSDCQLSEVRTLSSLETMSSEQSDYQMPRRGMVWGIHLSDEEFRAWIRPGTLGVNHDEPFIPVIGDEGLELRAWRTLMMLRLRNDWSDDPIDISYDQSIIFTQEVQVQTAPRVCAYPSRPWIALNPIVVERPAGAPEARRPTVGVGPPSFPSPIMYIRKTVHTCSLAVCSLMSQRLPLLLAAAGTGGGLGGLGVQVLSEFLRFGRLEPGPSVPSFFICPTPDLDSSAPLELPYSLDFLPCFYSSFLASRRGFPCITFHTCSSRACCLPSSSFVWHPSCRGIQPGDTEACVALAKEIGLFLRRSIEGGQRGFRVGVGCTSL